MSSVDELRQQLVDCGCACTSNKGGDPLKCMRETIGWDSGLRCPCRCHRIGADLQRALLGCPGAGKCHGPVRWCDLCGDDAKILCDDPRCCVHFPRCGSCGCQVSEQGVLCPICSEIEDLRERAWQHEQDARALELVRDEGRE